MKVNIFINQKKYSVEEGENILKTALHNDIKIPHYCYHEDLPVSGGCRICLVELENGKVVPSCTIKAQEGLKIYTDTDQVKQLRKKNLELLLAGHEKKCPKCQKKLFCQVKKDMQDQGITGDKYEHDKISCPLHKMGTAAEFDPEICVSCARCIQTCAKIGIGFLTFKNQGSKMRVSYNEDPKVDCIYCGQCTLHCPVNAIREQSHIESVEKALADKNKIVIVQTAPSVRATIGEEFGMPIGKDVTPQLATAYRMMGFDKVFDVNMGADITTIVEAEELLERLKEGKHLPMFTSCCPGWVKFVEFYAPEFIPNLTTSRSPQLHSGAAYKFWWAEKNNIDPKKIVVVSTMPCTSKKYEASKKELSINGIKPVDYSLTTRELAAMMKKRNIDLPNLKPSAVDQEGIYSGAAAIYGASGGVMESALRTAYFLATGKELNPIEFEPVRGMQGVKKATVKVGGKTLKLCVVATAKNVRPILEEIKKDPKAYDYIEVMACPGGCIGGGGQPLNTTDEIVAKRIEGLYTIDKKEKMRRAHENPVVKDFFAWVKKQPKEKQESLLYRTYSQKKKFE